VPLVREANKGKAVTHACARLKRKAIALQKQISAFDQYGQNLPETIANMKRLVGELDETLAELWAAIIWDEYDKTGL
jgi:hypothetical protein